MLPDGSFDLFMRQKEPSCLGTEAGYLAMKQLNMKINPNTIKFIKSCIGEKGGLVLINETNYIELESGLFLSEIVKTIPEELLNENDFVRDILYGISVILIGFGIAFLFVETFPSEYIKEYLIQVILFIICGVVSIMFMDMSYFLFLIFPVGVMGITHYSKWIMPFIADEYFSTISMMPALFGMIFYVVVSKFLPSFLMSLHFYPIMWILYVLGAYLAVPITNIFFTKEKGHVISYFVAAIAIGFSMMIIALFVTLSMSHYYLFLMNVFEIYKCHFSTFVAYPAVGYLLSMIASGFSIPKQSKAAMIKDINKKKK